jgi:hypothetical protein
MKKLLCLLLLTILIPAKLNACFGPELIIGYEQGNTELFTTSIIVELYIKEKTGVGVKLVPISENNINNLIQEEKIDIVLSNKSINLNKTSKKEFPYDKKYFLYYRTKINEDLRFTTVMESIEKLAKNINSHDIIKLAEKIKNERQERRIIKEFLMQRGLW